MKDKLKLLDLSKNFTVSRRDDNDEEYKDKGIVPSHHYKIDEKDSDLYAIINDDGKIEYWGYTGEYYDFEINIDELLKLKQYVDCLKGDNNENS